MPENENQSEDAKGAESSDLLARWKEVIGADFEKGRVSRFWDAADDSLPTIGIRCNDQQAILIKRLCGQISMNKFKEMGFNDEETRELLNMYETI